MYCSQDGILRKSEAASVMYGLLCVVLIIENRNAQYGYYLWFINFGAIKRWLYFQFLSKFSLQIILKHFSGVLLSPLNKFLPTEKLTSKFEKLQDLLYSLKYA